MEMKTILNITLFSTAIFFSACSSDQAKVKKTSTTSVYNIMGISQIQHTDVPSPVKISPDIEYISYRTTSPVYIPEEHQYTYVQTVDTIEANAKSFLGTPYVWGATGPSTFDCSGFTQWVYRDAGITIPRVSRDQARVGEYVAFNQLQRGDMMFFDTHKRRTGKVSHVGIYLGEGNFIHASSKGKKVVIYNFYEKPFYKKRFLWGRRVTENSMQYALN
jgi:cell wall-associated NlpC family hydrolase